MSSKRLLAVVVATALVLGAAAPGALAASDGESIDVTVEQSAETGAAAVTVLDDGSAVENATVKVTVGENATYAGTGTYETDANGTVALPEPNETVTVTVAVTVGDWSASDTGELVPREESLAVDVTQADDGTATATVTQYGEPVADATVNVSVDDNGTYAGTGTDETNANGTVALPEPNETVTVAVTATAGDLSAATTADLVVGEEGDGEDSPFGWRVSKFVQSLQADEDLDGPMGRFVASFVTEHNPGNAPDHAGPGGEGAESDDNETETRGPPEHAQDGTEKEDEEERTEDDGERGPPEHARN